MFTNEELASKVTGNGNEVNAMIAGVRTSGQQFQAMLKVAAASAVVHALQHGNSTPINDLIDAMGKHTRANSLKKWAIEVGPFVWAKDPADEKSKAMLRMNADKKAVMLLAYEADPAAANLNMIAKPFWEFDPEPVFQPVSALQALKAAISRLEKAAADPKRQSDENDFNGLIEMKQLADRLEASKGTKQGKKRSAKAVEQIAA
jgi:hypothetical protein